MNIRQGGLFRCCIETASLDATARDAEPVQGETLTCLYCKKQTMVYKDDAWEWSKR